MMIPRSLGRFSLIALLLCLAAGYFQFSTGNLEEEKDLNFIEGKKRANALDFPGAVENFEKALQSNPNSAAAHFELGILYAEKIHDYTAALYHYQKHLQLRPNSPLAEVVKLRMTACKMELAKTVSFAVVNREVQRDLERLAQTNNALKLRIEQLEADLAKKPEFITNFFTNTLTVTQYITAAATLSSSGNSSVARESREKETAQIRAADAKKLPPATNRAATPLVAITPPKASSYTVRSGETMASIARKYNIELDALLQANPRINPKKLRPGQAVVIPAPRR